MKPLLLFTPLFAMIAFLAPAQSYPIVRGVTVTPAEPTDNDQVIIATSIEIPYQGHQISQSHEVWQDDYKIFLYSCYYSGTQPATQVHLDTFYVGKLEDGYWAVTFKSRLSQDPGSCNPADSSDHALYLQVDQGPLSVISAGKETVSVWPNPCNDVLNVDPLFTATYRIFSAAGRLVETGMVTGGKINTETIVRGLYLVEISDANLVLRRRFVKM